MDLTPANLQIFFTGVQTAFWQGYQTAPIWSPKISMELPSDTELETYGWMDMLPRMREWVGPRIVNNVAVRSRSLVNKDWEDTISLERNKVQDDKYGLFGPVASLFGMSTAKLPDQLFYALIQANPVCFDGKAFFATDHPTNIDDPTGAQFPAGVPATWSNSFNLALTPSNYSSVRASMMSINGRNGFPLYIRPNLLVVSPALEEAARNILNADFIAPALFGGQTQVGANTNTLKGSAEVLVVEEFNQDPTAWYLLDTRLPVKPFLLQMRQPVRMIPKISPTDDNVFWLKEFIFGADARMNVDVTLPWLAAKSKP